MENESQVPPPRPQAPPRRSQEETKFLKFDKLKTEAYTATSSAMTLDEQGKKEEAFKAYQDALLKIDKAILVAHEGGFPASQIDKVEELVYKMRMTRKEVLERVSDLQHATAASAGPSSNPGYLDGPSSNPTEVVQGQLPQPAEATRSPPPYSLGTYAESTSGNLYAQLSGNLEEIALAQAAQRDPLPVNAQEVFTIPDNIQIYFIGTDDNVLAPSYPSFLRIVVLNPDSLLAPVTPPGQLPPPPAFLQVGDWTYPLIPGQSPVFRSPRDGSYIFPDLVYEGANIGLILPPEVSAVQQRHFEDLLLYLIGLEAFPRIASHEEEASASADTALATKEEGIKPKQPDAISEPQLPESTSTRISTKIAEGAETVAQGLIVGAEKTSDLLNRGTHYMIGKIRPVDEKPNINPHVKSYMKRAKTITGHTVQISGYIVTQLGRGTAHLGRKIAPYIHSTSAKLYAKSTKASEAEANEKVGQVLEVSGGALVGFGTVYLGLEHAAKVLASSLANNTVQVVNHRYGHEAGCLAEDAAATVGNTVTTGYNCHYLGPKSVAKRVVKDAAKSSLQPQIPKTKK